MCDHAPAGRRDRRVAGQHGRALAVDEGGRAAAAAGHLVDRGVAGHHLADAVGIGVVDDPPLAVDHVQVGTIAVEMLAQQPVEDVFLLQVDGATDRAEEAAARIADRADHEHDEIAGCRQIRLADQRLARPDRFTDRGAGEGLALQLQRFRRGRQYLAGIVEDDDGIEALAHQPQAGGFLVEPVGIVHLPGQQLGGVIQLQLRGLDEVVGALGELGGVRQVAFKGAVDQLLPLHLVAGMQRLGERQESTQQGQGQYQLAQVHRRRCPPAPGCPIHRTVACSDGSGAACRRFRTTGGHAYKKKDLHYCRPFVFVVAGEGIEPPTRGFSIPCSTN